MDNNSPPTEELEPFHLARPADWRAPLVFASPHSGCRYPDAFVDAARLDPVSLRRSEDAFVDEIFASAPDFGAPLLKANFPRAYIDPNREPYELDPKMFDGPLPDYVNTTSTRVAAGLGTVPRVVTSGENIYRDKLNFDATKQAIEACYEPYHAALEGLLDEAVARFGGCLLVDCHSMPSVGGPMDRDPGFRRVDFVLGDRRGASCAPVVTRLVEDTLAGMGHAVTLNNPYAGGFTTEHYGKPARGRHALQIEINRALYMDELNIQRADGMAGLVADMSALIETLTAIDPDILAAS